MLLRTDTAGRVGDAFDVNQKKQAGFVRLAFLNREEQYGS